MGVVMADSKRRRTSAEWEALCAAFESSGQSGVAFCAQRGLCLSHFYKRHRRYGRERQAFVAVEVERKPLADMGVVVELGAVTIRCTAQTPPGWIAEFAARLP